MMLFQADLFPAENKFYRLYKTTSAPD